MTFEPATLEALEEGLDGEVRSVGILRARLDGLVGAGGEDGGRERRGGKSVERAREVLDAYAAWLSDTSREFAAVETHREAEDVRFRFPGTHPPSRSRRFTNTWQTEVQDIVRLTPAKPPSTKTPNKKCCEDVKANGGVRLTR